MAEQINMDNFTNQLDNISVEPASTSWLKLENRLQDQQYVQSSQHKHRFYYAGAIAASLLVLVVGVSMFYNKSYSQSLEGTEGFVVLESSFSELPPNDIYNIKTLTDLHLAYRSKGF